MLLADGSTKAIETIREGDEVLAAKPTSPAEAKPHRVTHVFHTAAHRLFHIQVAGSDTGEIAATASHPFWTQRGWVTADHLLVFDRFVDNHGSWSVITAITSEAHGLAPTFNLSVEGTHTYFVLAGTTAILVHNNSDDPWNILFTQDSYDTVFQHGPYAGETIEGVAQMIGEAGDLPEGFVLRVVRMGDGRYAALNNRTLALARRLNLPQVDVVDVGDAGVNEYNRKLKESGLLEPTEHAEPRVPETCD